MTGDTHRGLDRKGVWNQRLTWQASKPTATGTHPPGVRRCLEEGAEKTTATLRQPHPPWVGTQPPALPRGAQGKEPRGQDTGLPCRPDSCAAVPWPSTGIYTSRTLASGALGQTRGLRPSARPRDPSQPRAGPSMTASAACKQTRVRVTSGTGDSGRLSGGRCVRGSGKALAWTRAGSSEGGGRTVEEAPADSEAEAHPPSRDPTSSRTSHGVPEQPYRSPSSATMKPPCHTWLLLRDNRM